MTEFTSASTTDEATPGNPLLERLARNVRTFREHYGWSLATLAERAGVSINIVKHLLRGGSNPGISTVIRLANAAGIPLGTLLDDEIDRATLVDESSIIPQYRDADAMASAIGPRTRAYRMRNNWSRRRFIEHAKISKGMLHYLETSAVEPSVTMVERLATAFGMSFTDFIEVAESPVISIARASAGEHLLTHLDATERVDLEDCRLSDKRVASVPTHPPGSTAMLYVVEGAIRVSFEGEHHLLQNGDAVLLMTDRPYSVSSTSAEAARFLRFTRTKNPPHSAM